MPELPEIETVKRTLAPLLIGRRIMQVELLRGEVIKHPAPQEFAAALAGRCIESLGRRGKYLLLKLDNGATLAAHLRMTGRFLCAPPEHPRQPHTHVVLHLDNGMELRFSDVRRFGCLWLIAADEEDDFTGMSRLGAEPLTEDFSADYLQQKLGKRKVAIKNGILDQHVIAGLGNIYADETLFRCGVHPLRLCNSLSNAEWQRLAEIIPDVLLASIANNGTTFSDFLDGEGREGQNMPHLFAYGRVGQPCKTCGSLMQKIRIGGRGTCFCPQCQPEK